MSTKPQTLEPRAPESPARKMLIGAETIAQFLYDKSDDKAVRDVYRNIAGLTFFKHGNSLAAFTDTLVAELRQHEQKAREERQRIQQEKEEQARRIVKPRRRQVRQTPQEVSAE
jgi:hypothetical protein